MHPLTLVPILSLGLAAQDALEDLRPAWAAQHRAGCHLLCATPALGLPWAARDEPLSALLDRQLRLVPLSASQAKALADHSQGPGWILVSPGGTLVAEGRGRPTPREILAALEGHGWTWDREALKAHLRRHPGQAQAWLELAHDLARQAKVQREGGAPLAHQARTRGALAEALDPLARVAPLDDAWTQVAPKPFPRLLVALKRLGFDQAPDLAPLITRLWHPLGDLIALDPENPSPWGIRVVLDLEDRSTRDLAELDSLAPVPGRPWPPLHLLMTHRLALRHRPEEMAQRAEAILARNLEAALVRRQPAGYARQQREAWGALKLEALLRRAAWGEALAWIEVLRRESGSDWPPLASALGKALVPEAPAQPVEDPEDVPSLPPDVQVKLRAALTAPPDPDPPGRALPRLRLALLDPAADALAWARLQAHPDLDPWDPQELTWTPLSGAERERLRAQEGLGQGQHWVLMQGGALLAHGTGCPTPHTLCDQLATQGSPRLAELDSFLRQHPRRQDARRERIHLLRSRLPHARLEARLRDDLALAGLPIGALPAPPDPARQVCAQTAERLQAWPFHPDLWETYADWSGVVPESPSPTALLETVDPWPRKLGLPLPGPLPLPCSLGVAQSLARQGRWSELAQWGRQIWEQGLRAHLRLHASSDEVDPGSVARLLSLWGQALGRTSQAEPLSDLRRDLIDMGLTSALGPSGHR